MYARSCLKLKSIHEHHTPFRQQMETASLVELPRRKGQERGNATQTCVDGQYRRKQKKSLVHEKQIEKDREKASIGETDSRASVQDRCAEAAAEGSV
jgi:hypothetical protein